MYTYKMVQLAPHLVVSGKSVKNGNNAAADYLQNTVNQHAENGWEFQRIDSFVTEVKHGFFARLFGKQNESLKYYVATFRKQINNV